MIKLMNMTIFYSNFHTWRNVLFALLALNLFVRCDNSVGGISEDPYAGGKEPLGIKLDNELPSPESGIPGTEVTFKATGLLNWCNPDSDRYDFDFYINNEKVEILTATDSSIIVRIPQAISSGISEIQLQDQVFFGPRFTVEGNVSIDSYYGLQTGTNGSIYDCLSHSNGGQFLVGDFYSVENSYMEDDKYYDGIVLITSEGSIVTSTSLYNTDGVGLSGTLMSINRFSDGKMLVSGLFSSYGDKSANSIALIDSAASINTKVVDLLNNTGNADYDTATVSSFNGGVLEDETILKSFVTSDDQVIAVGNMTTYKSADYDNSTYSQTQYNYTKVHSIMRMDENGKLDSTYHLGTDATGASGTINDACIDEDDGVIVVGDFNSFDGKNANGIVRINANGNVDMGFLSNIETGANGRVSLIRYNKNFRKAMIVGNFTEFNGKTCKGVAMINADGSMDSRFELKELAGGNANFSCLLNTDKVIVSGTFDEYDGVRRSGFLILNANGDVEQDFNVPGTFAGQIYKVVETSSAEGFYALLLMGNITRFDDQKVGNIVRVVVKNVDSN